MSAANAIQLATAIQSKVGSSLIASQNLLPKDEAAGTMVQAGAGSLGVFLLRDLYQMQERTYECVEKVAHILQSQLDLAEDIERRERDRLAEELKEKNKLSGGTTPITGGDPDLDNLEDKLDANSMMTMLTAGLTTALASGQLLKTLGKSIGKKLLKGGIYATIAGFIADPIVDYVNSEFDLDLDADAKKEIKLAMIGSAVGFGLFGIPGAIIGATVPAIAKVAQYIGGSINASDISDDKFATAGIGSAAIAMFTASKLGGLFAGSSIPAVATFGGALASLPVIVGIGAAVAVGAGAMFIAKKIDEYQELTLQKLEKTTAKLDKEMGEWAAREEESLFERMGINLGNLSAMGEAQVAAKEAFEQIGQDKDKFMANTEMTGKLTGLVNAITNYSDTALETILMDKTKGENFFSTLESLKGIAAAGGFGDESGAVFANLMAMSDKVQNTAIKMLAEGKKSDPIKAAATNKAGRIRGNIEGGDQLENIPALEEKMKVLTLKRADVERQLAIEQQKLEDMKAKGMKGDMNIFNKNEFEQQEALVEKLAGQLVYDRNNPQNLQNQIDRLATAINKFGTMNGLNYSMDQLREIMSDAEIKELIMRSVEGRGSEFLNQQKINNQSETSGGFVMQGNNSGNQQNNYASQNNYVRKLTESGDVYFAKEGFNYGL